MSEVGPTGDAAPATDLPEARPEAFTPPLPANSTVSADRPSRTSLILGLLVLAFVAGIVASIWGPALVRQWWNPAPAPTMEAANGISSPPPAPLPPQEAAALEAHMAALTSRLEDLSTRAQNAGGYASRAEALMVAFAARRALDNGAPLGYLEGELRLRFGEAQPRAVATIITAAHEPVTLADLQAGLIDATPALMGTAPGADWWTSTKRELASLIIVRKASSPSRIPQKAIEQARTLLLAGRTEAALAEVERLPGRAGADGWIQMARRYNEAHRALDVIEAAAILEPRILPSAAPPETPPKR